MTWPSRRALLLLLSAPAVFAQKRPFDVETLLRIQRIAEPAVSPDGKLVAFTVTSPDLSTNTQPKQIYAVPVDGGVPRQLTRDGDDNERPRWSPDSRQIYFISNRGGSSQIWVMDADGLRPRLITRLATEASGLLVSADGKKLVFRSQVYPECGISASALLDSACNQRNLDADAKAPSKARIYTSLLYRHWNEWQTRRRQHLLVANTDGTEVRDLTPGKRDVPPLSLGGPDGYAISPDSLELAFVMNVDSNPAASTNSDIYTVPLDGGEARKITISPGADESPLYSPDGKFLAFRSQPRTGYESDRWRLLVLDRATGKTTNLTETLDRWVGSFTWSSDSTRLFFTTEDRGRTGLQMIAASGGGLRSIISGQSTLDGVQFTSDGRTMIYTEETGSRPLEIFRATSGGGAGVALTHLNDALLAGVALTPLDEMWVDSSDKSRVHSFIVKPPNFTPARKYPVIFLLHGGPQSAWGESWTYRWNAQVFASAGYVVVQPNLRGSTGYGQKFIDEINGDWGGKPYDDIMSVVDAVGAEPYIDNQRMAVAGSSYGGYLANWINGHTNRFKAIVSHGGVFDLASWQRETDEQWFPLWEMKGTPADNPELYVRLSPSTYARDFKTPTLIMDGELDFRHSSSQALQLFTVLQEQNVPSKLVLFPDEGYAILKPQNSLLWYHTVLDWIDEWTKK